MERRLLDADVAARAFFELKSEDDNRRFPYEDHSITEYCNRRVSDYAQGYVAALPSLAIHSSSGL